MVADGMLTRQRYREVPPRVDYELTERARELAPILGELARWGYHWAWSPPRPNEAVDIGAIFRLIPGLMHEGSHVHGTIELTVADDHDGEPAIYRATLGPTGASLAEGEGDFTAGIRGAPDGWIRAFSPASERSGLRVSGDHLLAGALLDALALGSNRLARDAAVELATG